VGRILSLPPSFIPDGMADPPELQDPPTGELCGQAGLFFGRQKGRGPVRCPYNRVPAAVSVAARS
jgi:hypothetical protein